MKLLVQLLFCSLVSLAQATYTLEDCIEMAIRNHPDVTIQNLNIEQTRAILNQALKSRFPTLAISISNGINGGRNIDPFTNSFVQRTVSYNSYGLSGNWKLFNGFSLKNQIEQKKLSVQAEEIQLNSIKSNLKQEVIQAYMNVVIYEKLTELYRENEKDLLNQLESINEKIKEGALASYNRVETEAFLANSRFELLNSENNLKLAKVLLKQLIQSEKEFDIQTPQIPKHVVSENRNSIPLHSTLLVLDKKVQAAQYGVDVAKAGRLPSLSLNMGMGTSYSSAAADEFNYLKQLGHNFNQFLSFGLNIPILSNGQVNHRIQSEKIGEKIALIQRDKQELLLNQDIETRKLEISSLQANIESSEINVRAQSILYDGAKEKFREGLINNLELNTYRLNLERIKIQHIQIEYELFYKNEMLKIFYE